MGLTVVQPTQRLTVVNPGGPSVASDMAQSVAPGLSEGVASLGGMVGDAQNMLVYGPAKWLMKKFGMSEEEANNVVAATKATSMTGGAPTSQYLNSKFADATRGDNGQSPLEYQPQTFAGKVTKTGLSMVPAAALAPGTTGAKLASVLGASLGTEGASVADKGTSWEKYDPYLRFAGGVAGGGLAGGMADAWANRSRIPGQNSQSINTLRKVMPSDASQLEMLGPEGMVLDSGPAATGLAQGIAKGEPGANTDTMVNTLISRDKGRGQRLKSTVESIEPYQNKTLTADKLTQEARDVAGPMYDAAKAGATPLPADIMDQAAAELTNPSKGMDIGTKKRMLAEMGNLEQNLSGETPQQIASQLHDYRIKLSKQIEYSPINGDAEGEAVIKQMRNYVDKLLKNNFDFKEADKAYAGKMQDIRNYETGYNALGAKMDGAPVAPELYNQQVQEMAAHSGMPLPSLPPAYTKTGMVARLRDAMGQNQNDYLALKNQLGSEYNKENMTTTLGRDNSNKLLGSIENEGLMGANSNKIREGSQTTLNQSGADLLNAPSKPIFAGSESVGGFVGKLGEKLYNKAIEAIMPGTSERTKTALTQALLTKGMEGVNLINQLKSLPPPSQMKLVGAILGTTPSLEAFNAGRN